MPKDGSIPASVRPLVRSCKLADLRNPRLIQIFCDHFDITEDDINYGWCYQFAWVLAQLYPKFELRSCECWCHAWVSLGDKNFDSKHLKGTRKNLQMSCAIDPSWVYHQSSEEFKSHWWESQAEFGGLNIAKCDQVVKDFLKELK